VEAKNDVVMIYLEGRHRVGRIFLVADIDGDVCFGVLIRSFVRRWRRCAVAVRSSTPVARRCCRA
jgi:hypothetical protein